MNVSIKWLAVSSHVAMVAVLGLAAAPTAAAQTVVPTTATSASATQAESIGVGDIVVTAQRRSENLQTVPVTVSAVTSQMLANTNILTGSDLSKVVPSLSIQPNSQSVLLYLRGIGSNISAIGAEASVAFYIDGIYYSRLFPALIRLDDVEQVEVLKGPQGTLYGRNSSGGLVNIITSDPKPGAPVNAEASIGYSNYQTVDATAHLAFSLNDKVAVELSGVVHDQSKGYGINIYNGEQVNKDTSEGFRGKIVYAPAQGTEIKLTGEYIHEVGDASQSSHYYNHPQGFIDGSNRVLPTLNFYDVDKDGSDVGYNSEYGLTLRVRQDLGFAQISDTVAYHHLNQINNSDADESPEDVEQTQLYSYGHEIENDFQLTSNKGSRIDWNVGVFYIDQKQGYNPAYIGEGPDNTLAIYSNSQVRSVAGYGQARFPILDGLKGTIGFRYTHDHLNGDGFANFLISGVGTVPDVIPASSAAYNFNKATFKFALDYRFNSNIFGYASFSRGFKGATFNTIPFAATPAKPETLDAYEAGLKTELFDRHVRLNLAGFHYNLTNPQVILIPSPADIETANAGAAKIDGAEFDITFVPVPGLNFRAAGTYLKARYTDYADAPFYAVNTAVPYGNNAPISGNADGNRLPYAPRFSGNFGGDYTFPVGENSVTLGSNVSYNGKIYFHPDNRISQGSYTLVDAFVEYKLAHGLSLKAYGTNLTNHNYYVGAVEFGSAAGDLGFTGNPRTYGVMLRFKY